MHKNSDDDIRMAGPRLTVYVAELLMAAVKESPYSAPERMEEAGYSKERIEEILIGDGNYHISSLARVFAALGYKMHVVVTDDEGKELSVRKRYRVDNKDSVG